MTTTTEIINAGTDLKALKVGEVVVYIGAYNGKPTLVNVSRVTKTGLFRVTLPSGKDSVLYKNAGLQYFSKMATAEAYGDRYDRTSITLVQYLDQANARYEAVLAERVAKDAENEKRRKETEERETKELVELKALMNNTLNAAKTVMPDGTRVYTFTIPIKEGYNKKWEFVMVRCYEEKSWRSNDAMVTRMAGGSMTDRGGMSSHSATDVVDDDAGCWEMARRCYYSW